MALSFAFKANGFVALCFAGQSPGLPDSQLSIRHSILDREGGGNGGDVNLCKRRRIAEREEIGEFCSSEAGLDFFQKVGNSKTFGSVGITD